MELLLMDRTLKYLDILWSSSVAEFYQVFHHMLELGYKDEFGVEVSYLIDQNIPQNIFYSIR